MGVLGVRLEGHHSRQRAHSTPPERLSAVIVFLLLLPRLSPLLHLSLLQLLFLFLLLLLASLA